MIGVHKLYYSRHPDPNDPTEILNPSFNPGLVHLAKILGVDYLTVAFAFRHPQNTQYIEEVRKAIERTWG